MFSAPRAPRSGQATIAGWRVGTPPWDDLLEGEEVAHVEDEPAAAGAHRRASGRARTRALRATLSRSRAVRTSACSLGRSRARRAPDPRDRHGLGEVARASTCPCSTRSRASPKSRALYLYPTKALAQDQARALGELGAPGLRAAIYDGDTPGERRWQIRKWANLILTNPDMLHVGVLPHHDRWADVLHNLRYIVVDEAHVYRGVFGSHVANVLRRLRRLAARLRRGAAVLAGIGDDRQPRRARRSAARESRRPSIDDDAAPRAERTIALWNPS